ncbi:uncharacterized protein LOC129606578 isoform X2 [Condylostylus longicornis]|nr:uncharacterized protein LOC129606578 isoform X2 [Condylostylus longicornis]XP_055372935.1 uncharacterized protein LOC129606578 isoform X2 [Condylostylus longicornis]
MLNDSFFNGPTDPGCKAFDCEKHMKYCLGTYFLNDHCFCEQSHTNEGLPFVPHSCYVGEDNQAGTKPSIGSCFRFAEIKECCCLRPLAQRWKYLSTARIISNNLFLIIVLPIFLLLLN